MESRLEVRYYRAWRGLADFCGDCALARNCDLKGTSRASSCSLVVEQRALDHRDGKRRLLSNTPPDQEEGSRGG